MEASAKEINRRETRPLPASPKRGHIDVQAMQAGGWNGPVNGLSNVPPVFFIIGLL